MLSDRHALVKGSHVIKLHFSDYFDVSTAALREYGAFNVSLVNDLPLFVDPFLLFNSDKPEYVELHDHIVRYLRFLRDKSAGGQIRPGLLEAWFTFKEVKNNWFGYSRVGKGKSSLHNLSLSFQYTGNGISILDQQYADLKTAGEAYSGQFERVTSSGSDWHMSATKMKELSPGGTGLFTEPVVVHTTLSDHWANGDFPLTTARFRLTASDAPQFECQLEVLAGC